MSLTIRWTVDALRDLDDIREYIAGDSSENALEMVARIIEAAEAITMPTAASMVPEADDPTAREIFVGPYRVIFDVYPQAIEVLRVFHSARTLTAAAIRRRS